MKSMPGIFFTFISLLFLATSAAGADTTSVNVYQLNHYYTINALSNMSIDRPYGLFSANYMNRSNIYAKPSDETRIKQENLLDSRLLYKWNERLLTGLSARGYILSDEQHSSDNDYLNSRVGLSGLWRGKLYVSGSTGLFNEKRRNIEDTGWYSNLDIKTPKANIISPLFRLSLDKTPERINYTTDNHLDIETPFMEGIFNHLILRFKETRREYFTGPSHPGRTEIRTTTNREVQDRFSYILPMDIRFRYHVRFLSSTDRLDYFLADSSINRKRDSYQFGNQVNFSKKTNRYYLKAGFSLDQNQDRSSASSEEIRLPADYKYGRKTISALSSYYFSSTDSLSMKYQISLLQFDTPDTNNTDDRDELSYVINPRLSMRLSPHIRWNLSGQLYLHHLIYLHSERSAQNHWNRVYQIRSDLFLNIPAKLIWTSTQSLSSNYFIYDYEDSSFVSVSSRIFRSLYIDQAAEYFVTPDWSVKFKINGRLEDDGSLDWDRFIQDKTTERIQVRQELLLNYRTGSLKIFAGPVFSRRWFYQHNPGDTRSLIHYVYRKGIRTGIQFKTAVRLKYTIESIRQTNRKSVYNQNGSLQVSFIL